MNASGVPQFSPLDGLLVGAADDAAGAPAIAGALDGAMFPVFPGVDCAYAKGASAMNAVANRICRMLNSF